MRAFGKNVVVGKAVSCDDAPQIIVCFRLEESPLMIVPDSGEETSRVIAWISSHPEQVALLQHSLKVVCDVDSLDDLDDLPSANAADTFDWDV